MSDAASRAPEAPEVAEGQRAQGKVQLRYEDLSQDGRVMPAALMQSLGGQVWADLLGKHPAARATRKQGVIPILTRLVFVGEPGPFTIARPFEAEARFDLAHARGASGEVDRVLLRLWGRLSGPHGSMLAAPPPPEPTSLAGTAYAEHVFTRLFAPPDQRKVRSLEAPGVDPVPGPSVVTPAPSELLSLPEGAAWLGDGLAPDEAPVCFSISHTDSNQHVNSLVYPRLFEEAGLRRLNSHKESTALLARVVECAYRKPCFAGDRMRFWSRAFRADGGARGAVGALLPEGASPESARPHCYVRVLWQP